MELFSYSFAVSMLHSIWQSAILLLFYLIVTCTFRKFHPAAKRNLLFIILATQLSISAFTFTLYYNNFFGNRESHKYSELFFDQTWLRTHAGLIFNIYMLAVVYQLTKVSYNWLYFKKKYSQNLVKPPVDLKMFMLIKADHFGIKRKVSLWLSNGVSSPVTFGFWKPVILMPFALINKLSIAEAESLIVHELTHIRNNDFVLNLFLILTESIYFFNPFIKIISKNIRIEREKNCDIKVIDFNYQRIQYAETLLKIARENGRIKGLQLGAVLNKPQLNDRIQFFSQENLQFSNKNKTLISCTGIVLAIIINLLILLHAKHNVLESPAPLKASARVSSNEFLKDVIPNELIPTLVKEHLAQPAMQERSGIVDEAKEHYIESNEEEELNYALAAGNHEEYTTPGKELIVNDEDSSGKITSAYNVQFKNGEWVLQPLWMISETKAKADSLKNKADSLVKFFNTIQ